MKMRRIKVPVKTYNALVVILETCKGSTAVQNEQRLKNAKGIIIKHVGTRVVKTREY